VPAGPVPAGTVAAADDGVPAPVEHAMFSLEGGQAATTRLLRHGVTGVICGSDVLALGAIRAVRRAGLSVPRDVSVVGYDDSAFMNCTDPPLTTVRQPIEAMGKAAVTLLVSQIENMAVYPEELLFEPELVVRGSTGRGPVVTSPVVTSPVVTS
jgi:DNA-binding LacI/PurR family transcriptional regulator